VLTTVDHTGNTGAVGLPVLGSDYNGSNSHTLVINGNGARIMRSTAPGTPEFRLLRVLNFSGSAVTISRVTFTNGRLLNGDGGAIHTNGLLILNECTIRNNSAAGGGGIFNHIRTAELNYCTIANNTALNGSGGAVKNNGGRVGLNTCTVVDNSATAAANGIYNFGNDLGAYLEVFNCTFSGNGISNISTAYVAATSLGDTILKNSPLASTTQGGDLSTITSHGFNLSSDNGGGFLTAIGDRTNTDPKLDPLGLAANGGPTQTIALTHLSPAIDQGNAGGIAVDQRGVSRIYDLVNAAGGDGSDVGAFEAPADPVQTGPTYSVTTTNDHNDGICSKGDCTLREALARTNAAPGADTITFAPAVIGTITLLPAVGGQLNVTDTTTITGPGARVLAISGNTQTRILQISASTVVSGLTLRDGFPAATTAGGSVFGGAVLSQALTTFRDCTFKDNRAVGDGGVSPGGNGGSGSGGAIASFAGLVLDGCTFTGNGATGGTGANNPPPDNFTQTNGGTGGSGRGGAVFNEGAVHSSVFNCTFTSNNAGGASGGSGHNGGAGGGGTGGAICNLGALRVESATFSGNSGFGGSGGTGRFSFTDGPAGRGIGGLAAGAGSIFTIVRTTLSAGNTGNRGGGGDVDGAFTSEAFNLIGNGDFSSGFNQPTDQVGTSAAMIDAKLAGLQNNGGNTDTLRLLEGSPAIDRGKAYTFRPDQRGSIRPFDNPALPNASGGDGTDIGAYEVGNTLRIVTTLDDLEDGTCNAAHCSLRDAIAAANAQVDPDVIRFAPGVTGTIQLTAPLPPLSSDMTLEGPGANLLTVARNTAAITGSSRSATAPSPGRW
jgi:fibronectin-binding autotransporter adhesin